MFILTYEMPLKEVDSKIELLQINDIFNTFYESPLEITTDENGYGYIEKEDDIVNLKIAFDGEENELPNFTKKVTEIMNEKPLNVYEENYTYDNFSIPAIEINDEWILASPEEEVEEGKKKIILFPKVLLVLDFHETTQDLLMVILEKDFTNKRILDIGTGSGILSLATAIKNASEVVAVDIRDVKDEVELNASLNNISTIKTLVGDALSGEITIEGDFDWIYINIGGEETEMFMPLITKHLKKDGELLVSGLVQWSFDKVKNMVESYGFKIIEKHETNEWCTAIFIRA